MLDNEIWIKLSNRRAEKYPIVDRVVECRFPTESAFLDDHKKIIYKVFKSKNEYSKNQPLVTYHVNKNNEILHHSKFNGNTRIEEVDESTFIVQGVRKHFSWITDNHNKNIYKTTEHREINGTPYEIGFLDGVVDTVVFRHNEYHRHFKFRMRENKLTLFSIRTTYRINTCVQIQLNYQKGRYSLHDPKLKFSFPSFNSIDEFPEAELSMHLSMAHSIAALPVEMYNIRDIEMQVLGIK